VAPNYAEACAGESRADFVYKLGICLKELRETRSWLQFIVRAELLPPERTVPVLKESDELCSIFVRSLVTAKSKQNRPKT
jgi:four helix bundle protein